MHAGTTVSVLCPQGAFIVPGQNETSKLERLRSAILAAARSADFEAMHDAIVAYHQLLGIEEGEPDTRQLSFRTSGPPTQLAASAVVGCIIGERIRAR